MWPIFRSLLSARTPVPPLDGDAVKALGALRLDPAELRSLLGTDSLEPHFTYSRFRRPKASGGWREIAEPDPRLKLIQRQIVRQFLQAEAVHPAAVAYRPGLSTRDHVRPHAGAAVVVTADVQDFFPSTRTERVAEFWRARFDADAARALALLTTDSGGLPQGAPTSPALSNVVNVELDTRLALRASSAGAKYTRYCDDLAFSWPRGFGPPSDFERAVRAALHAFGYALHPRKGWSVYELADEPEVTGVVLTRWGGVRLPDRVRDVMRRLARSDDPRARARLEGYRGYAAMILGRRKR